MNLKNIALPLIAASLLLTGCGSNDNAASTTETPTAMASVSASPAETTHSPTPSSTPTAETFGDNLRTFKPGELITMPALKDYSTNQGQVKIETQLGHTVVSVGAAHENLFSPYIDDSDVPGMKCWGIELTKPLPTGFTPIAVRYIPTEDGAISGAEFKNSNRAQIGCSYNEAELQSDVQAFQTAHAGENPALVVKPASKAEVTR